MRLHGGVSTSLNVLMVVSLRLYMPLFVFICSILFYVSTEDLNYILSILDLPSMQPPPHAEMYRGDKRTSIRRSD
jgi:hypothetical protein